MQMLIINHIYNKKYSQKHLNCKLRMFEFTTRLKANDLYSQHYDIFENSFKFPRNLLHQSKNILIHELVWVEFDLGMTYYVKIMNMKFF